MAALQVQVEAVRNAVASSSTCTPAAVVSLKSLLLPRDAEPATTTVTTTAPKTTTRAAPSSRPATACGTATTAKRRAAAPRGNGRVDAEAPCLSDKERAQLATHVINASLKALAEAAKPTPPTPKTPSRIKQLSAAAGDDEQLPAPPATARGGLRRSMSAPLTPLQPRTLNRVSTSPTKASSKTAAAAAAAASAATAQAGAHCLARVECARVAFAALRTLHDAKAVTLPELQLEAGMSSFVAKLIALNMLDQACRELRVLKKRLQGPPFPGSGDDIAPAPPVKVTSKATKSAKTAKPSALPATSASTESMAASILDYGDLASASMPAVKLIVASQLQALRILVALRKPAHVDAALPFLHRSCRSAPVHLLARCTKAAAASPTELQKTVRQMETLAQLLLALTPSISSKDDASAVEPKLSIAPPAALELQTLSLETRLRCWILTPGQSRGDADKDILAPFSRCLVTYARRSRAVGKTPSYASCRSRFDHLVELAQTGSFELPRTSKSPVVSIYQHLGAMARESGNLDDAVHWASELYALVRPSDDSAAKCCSISAQLLALQLRNPAKSYPQSSHALLASVLDAMKGSLKGDTADLEELLANVCLVRKAAVNLLLTQTQKNRAEGGDGVPDVGHAPAPKVPPSTKLLLESFVYHCPRFCLRWLGKPPAARSTTKDFLRYEQRRQLLSQSIRHTLDSAFVVTKTMIEEGRMVWEQLDSVLSDSLTVLEYLGDLKTTDAASSYYVKISHFYYLSYNALRQKSGGQIDPDVLKALRRAVDCVKHRPGPERERAQLVLKLERLADLAKAAGQIGEALGALQSIRTSLVDDGALTQVTTDLGKLPPPLAWTASDQAESLSRTLISIHRLEQVHLDWTASLDDLEQAAVLEHRLHFIYFGGSGRSGLSKPSSSSDQGAKLDLSHPCIESLLRIYYPTQYPIRRLRILLRLFSANIDAPDVLADIAPQTNAALGLIESQGLADDAALASYLVHYKALASSLLGFSEGYKDIGTLSDSLTAWSELVAAHPTRPELERAVDSIADLQTHLHSIAEFMRAMGRDTCVTSVLELSAKLAKAATESADDRSLPSLPLHDSALALSSHYIRVGDCVKAGQALEQVRCRLESSDTPSLAAKMSFHLSYAEYLVAVGRLDEANTHLLKAQPASHEEPSHASGAGRISGSLKRRLGAHACFLQSLVALERGDYSVALQNARSGVRMLFQDWCRLEKSLDGGVPVVENSLSGDDEGRTAMYSASSSDQSFDELGSSLHGTLDQGHLSTGATTPDESAAVMTTVSSRPVSSPDFWTLFHPLFNSMLRLSSIYAHLGLFQETIYYAEQAHKIAGATNAALSLAEAEAWLGAVYQKAGDLQKAADFASQARSRLPMLELTSRKAKLACDLGSLYREMDDSEGEQEMMQQVEAIVQHVSASGPGQPTIAGLDDGSSAQQEAKPRAAAKRQPRTTSAATAKTAATTTSTRTRRTAIAAKPTKKKAVAAAPAPGDVSPVVLAETSGVLDLRAAFLVQKAMSHLSKKDWVAALSIIRSGGENSLRARASKGQAAVLAEHIALATCLLGHSTEQMARDAVFSVIQDSTLSFPAVSAGGSSGVAAGMGGSAGETAGDRLSLGKSPLASKTRSVFASKTSASFVEMLQEAQDCLIEAQAIAAVSGDASTLNRISSMLQSAVLVLSATSWSKPRALGHPGYASCSVELARNMTWQRERRAVLVEKAAVTGRQEGPGSSSWWPAVSSAAAAMPSAAPVSAAAENVEATPRRRASFVASPSVADTKISRFQRDYIDIIPTDWCVLSMALTENKHDLCITKLQAGQSPFVIRLPLERAISRDADNEVFNFQQGRSELVAIVQAINASCHDARDMTVKGAKSAWWAEREALDQRLKALLDNMEEIWLGGFRGIFSQHVRRPALFARFQKTFQSILDKHLPSRQAPMRGKKRGAGGKASSSSSSGRVSLDPRVLDLFIGLGDATAEGCDFDDALDDLLYFVVDILQFHGERNAYDEIDFDSMVVETFDALYAYHSAAAAAAGRASGGDPAGQDRVHSILVLDKALHVFPWEALPCMDGLAVSRVPSLACLRRLLLDKEARERQAPTAAGHDADALLGAEAAATGETRGGRPSGSTSGSNSGYRASAACGAYMLNPSGDLRSTETTFDGPLASGLRGMSWTRIVGRAPTEDEFEAVLRDKDVLLYFGHGSGAQYIRGRTVRKLERCRATALLMGCSSAGLNYHGEFELQGPVWDYMLAGCPAVVGTLWDVTDKDIDRFAGRAFEEWGLVARGTFGERRAAGSATQRRAAAPSSSSSSSSAAGAASLVEAVVRAREAPRFRYLTAAAVCVYGIPVYLTS